MVKLVYIAHKIAGNVNENVKDVLRICREVHNRDIVPIAPYLVAVQYLDNHLIEERELGIATNREHFKRKVMDEVWLCGSEISTGMKEEIILSLKYEIPIKCYNHNLQPQLGEFVAQYKSNQ